MSYAFAEPTDGLLCYQSLDDPSQFYYLPAAPTAGDDAGMPSLRALEDGVTLLTLAGEWLADRGAVNQLQAAVAAHHPELNPDLIEIDAAPPERLTLDRMELTLVGDDGKRSILAALKPSNIPPFTTLFNVRLNDKQAKRARAAVERGAPEVLLLTLHYALTVGVRANAHVHVDFAALLARYQKELALIDAEFPDEPPAPPTEEDARRLLDGGFGHYAKWTTAVVPRHLGRAFAAAAAEDARAQAVKVICKDLSLSATAGAQANVASVIDVEAAHDGAVRIPSGAAWLSATTDLGRQVATARQL